MNQKEETKTLYYVNVWMKSLFMTTHQPKGLLLCMLNLSVFALGLRYLLICLMQRDFWQATEKIISFSTDI